MPVPDIAQLENKLWKLLTFLFLACILYWDAGSIARFEAVGDSGAGGEA